MAVSLTHPRRGLSTATGECCTPKVPQGTGAKSQEGPASLYSAYDCSRLAASRPRAESVAPVSPHRARLALAVAAVARGLAALGSLRLRSGLTQWRLSGGVHPEFPREVVQPSAGARTGSENPKRPRAIGAGPDWCRVGVTTPGAEFYGRWGVAMIVSNGNVGVVMTRWDLIGHIGVTVTGSAPDRGLGWNQPYCNVIRCDLERGSESNVGVVCLGAWFGVFCGKPLR
ncbi:hypothetical protein HispidOSU_008094 [Sigmodon hispidus]